MRKLQSSTGKFEKTNIHWSCCGIKGPRFSEFTCCYQSQRRIQIYRSRIAQWPCNIANSFEVLLRRPVIQAQQSVLSDELQTCWAECNLFPSLPTELRCYESSLVMCLISEPVHWHWNTGQPASQKKIMTFLRVLGILTHKQKYWVENPSPPKMITTFKGFFHETNIYYNPNPNHIYWKLSCSPCFTQKKNPFVGWCMKESYKLKAESSH